MNPLLLIGLLGGGALLMIGASKGQAKPAGTTIPGTSAGGKPVTIDVGQILTDAFNAMGPGVLTETQLGQIRIACEALGVDDQGKLTGRPSPESIAHLRTLAAELTAQGVSPVVPLALTALATAASALPQGNTVMSGFWSHGPWSRVQGPWQHLGSLTEQNRKIEPCLSPGSYTDISGSFGDWWDTFVQKWASNWWRSG